MLRWGEFVSNAGHRLPFKIELDELTDADWDCLARMVAGEFAFSTVEGVPTGGLRFAEALQKYVSPPRVNVLLLVDDVLTTGGSMERQRAGRDAMGVVVFARSKPVPSWIIPIFRLGSIWRTSAKL